MIYSFWYGGLPPSENAAYAQVGRMRKLTTEAKAWKRRFHDTIWEEHGDSLTEIITLAEDDLWIDVGYDVHFPSLVNKGWLKGKAKTRYKKSDARTRIKLLEDALSEALGIDDSRFQIAHIKKWHDPHRPGVRLQLEVIDPETYGVPEGYIGDIARPVSSTRELQRPGGQQEVL